ncbi:MAG: DUF6702 family protein [Pseudomonadota bacterium]
MQRRFFWSACLGAFVLSGLAHPAVAHPLRLSLTEIEHVAEAKRLMISLRLFLTDVNEALVFNPDSTELAFCQPDEAGNAEFLLLTYLNMHFAVTANGQAVDLQIKSKSLHGEGINTALQVVFEHPIEGALNSLEVKNTVFTDLFFDQNNIVYVYTDKASKSMMLSKQTPRYALTF